MLVTTVDKKIKFYQRVILMIMLVFMPFYSVGSDFFLEGFPSSSIEVVENGVHDVLDFDDNASLRTVRQEFILLNCSNVHSCLYFINFIRPRVSSGFVPI